MLRSNLWNGIRLGCVLALATGMPIAAQAAGFKVLYAFRAGTDGASPEGLLRVGHTLYGTTYQGGGTGCFDSLGCGTVFKIGRTGTETVLHSFDGTDGNYPEAGVLADASGNLYGTTSAGGGYSDGTFFTLHPDGTEDVIYFTGTGGNGAQPNADLIMDKSGNIFGTANYGGANGAGTVFKVSSGILSVLYSFCSQANCTDGSQPDAARLTEDGGGNLYGTTVFGGAHNEGAVFKLAPNGTESVLYSFTGGSDGGGPTSDVIFDPSGNLYGTTLVGGANGYGTVFKLAANGTESVLYSFSKSPNNAYPNPGDVIRDASGNLYGTTSSGGNDSDGLVFKLAPNGTFTTLHTFTGGTDGSGPRERLLVHQGYLYGATYAGGEYGYGTMFKLPE